MEKERNAIEEAREELYRLCNKEADYIEEYVYYSNQLSVAREEGNEYRCLFLEEVVDGLQFFIVTKEVEKRGYKRNFADGEISLWSKG